MHSIMVDCLRDAVFITHMLFAFNTLSVPQVRTPGHVTVAVFRLEMYACRHLSET